jgi:hypothetical protein
MVSSQVRIQPCSMACGLVRSRRSISRSMADRTSSGSTRSAILSQTLGDVLVVGSTFTQLLADGRELLAQEELPLLLPCRR